MRPFSFMRMAAQYDFVPSARVLAVMVATVLHAPFVQCSKPVSGAILEHPDYENGIKQAING
jgi:hypothetical protein